MPPVIDPGSVPGTVQIPTYLLISAIVAMAGGYVFLLHWIAKLHRERVDGLIRAVVERGEHVTLMLRSNDAMTTATRDLTEEVRSWRRAQ
jgi:hypothetical protein